MERNQTDGQTDQPKYTCTHVSFTICVDILLTGRLTRWYLLFTRLYFVPHTNL